MVMHQNTDENDTHIILHVQTQGRDSTKTMSTIFPEQKRNTKTGTLKWNVYTSSSGKVSFEHFFIPGGIWCEQLELGCYCRTCCTWHWCSTWWHPVAGYRTRRAFPGPSRRPHGCGPAALHRYMPAVRPSAGSAADITHWGCKHSRDESLKRKSKFLTSCNKNALSNN